MMPKLLFWGGIARLFNCATPVENHVWVFGSDYGNTYREGCKYLFEYVLKEHPEYNATFVTQSKEVYANLRQRGYPCVINTSIKGLIAIARAECVFTSQDATDILYAFKKPNRRYYYIVHGQPMKVAQLALAKEEEANAKKGLSWWKKLIRAAISKLKCLFLCDYDNSCSEFVGATSDFLKIWMEKDFGNKVPVKVLGMPRNDALFQGWRMESERWVDGVHGKFIISYMPTHRLYGKGRVSPTPFEHFAEAQDWMLANNVVLLVKNHPNMLKQFSKGDVHPYESSCIRDITASRIDPMTVVYNSDVLITDYSSVWMDYLLLRRPLIFYIYDNFKQDDVGVYYDPIKENAGYACDSERGLFELIKRIKKDYDNMRPSDAVVRKFHKYTDGYSCKRYFEEVVKVGK